MKPITFWIVFTIGIILRVFMINVPALWYDENFTLILARLPFGAMLSATAGDVHPPLWYLIEWCIFHVAPGAPVWMIRLPALIFSVASLPLFVMVMRQIGISSQVQRAAFLLMAVMPFQLWYAQEGRMYAMLEFLVLVTLLAGLTQNYIGVFIGSVCLLYSQNYGPFYMAAIALVIFIREKQDVFNWTMAAMLSSVIAWYPWVRVLFSQMDTLGGGYWITNNSAASVLITLYKLFFTASVPERFFTASYLITFAALLFGLYAFSRGRHPARAIVAIMAFVPLLIAVGVSLVWQPVLLFRPLIGISPFIYLIASWSLDNVAHRPDRLSSVHPGIARSPQ